MSKLFALPRVVPTELHHFFPLTAMSEWGRWTPEYPGEPAGRRANEPGSEKVNPSVNRLTSAQVSELAGKQTGRGLSRWMRV